MTQFDLTPFYRSSIGLDRMAHLMDSLAKTTQGPSQPNWPPYNIEKEGEATYRITMAVAGSAMPISRSLCMNSADHHRHSAGGK